MPTHAPLLPLRSSSDSTPGPDADPKWEDLRLDDPPETTDEW